MSFISWAFVLSFLPILAYRLTFGRDNTRPSMKLLNMAYSMLFVMWHVPAYILIMLATVFTDFFAALWLGKGTCRRRLVLVAALSVNLLLLGFFKYANSVATAVEQLTASLGYVTELPRSQLPLPIAISFYTFCSMGYTIDVFRRSHRPVRKFSDYLSFVIFFPHLVSGPILRAERFFYQLHRRRRPHMKVFNEGAFLIVRGLFLKMVCADRIGLFLEPHWQQRLLEQTSASSLVALAVLFAIQLFCDFEGYTSIARGLAYWLGYKFPINFNYPFIAHSFSNFWERWHMTLSSWFRDYVFAPIALASVNARLPSAPSQAFGVFIVFLVSGIWHGSGETFVVWGLFSGLFFIIERALRLHNQQRTAPVWKRLGWYVVAQGAFVAGTILFRSRSLAEAGTFFGRIARFQGGEAISIPGAVFGAAAAIIVMHAYAYAVERGVVRPLGKLQKAVLGGCFVFATLTSYGTTSEFIYFQF